MAHCIFLYKFHEELPSHSQQADTDSILGLCVRQSLTDTQSKYDKLPHQSQIPTICKQ